MVSQDEADILGDRIAIMAAGQLRCAGSSLFLKKHYGVGYQLTIEKNPKATTIGSSAHASHEDKTAIDDNLQAIVTGAVSEASLLSNVGTEMSFQLPLGAAANFTPMFEALDTEVDDAKIVTYGVSITTLDEVFLLVARGETGDKTELRSRRMTREMVDGDMTTDENNFHQSRMNVEDDGLFLRHFQALFQKRALSFKVGLLVCDFHRVVGSMLTDLNSLSSKFSATRRLGSAVLSFPAFLFSLDLFYSLLFHLIET
jgi:ATP-binding cassette, subfamily A (ABC1), member 3